MKKQEYAIVDIETTGGNATHSRITEIAIVIHDGEKILETYETLINPERSIPYFITQVTGITDNIALQDTIIETNAIGTGGSPFACA